MRCASERAKVIAMPSNGPSTQQGRSTLRCCNPRTSPTRDHLPTSKQLCHIPVVDSVYTDGMDKFLLSINHYIHDEMPDFRQFYNWFQDAYFGDQNSNVR